MALIHRSQLAGALPVCTSDDSRYYLKGAAVLPDGTVAATNGHVLVQLSPREPLNPNDAPPALTGAAEPIPAPAAGGGSSQTVIPYDSAKQLVAFTKNVGAKRIPILQTIAVTPTNGVPGTATVTDLERQVSVRCVEEARFPDISRVIPDKRPETADDRSIVTFDARVLKQLLDSAIAQADASGEPKGRPVRLTFQVNGPQKATRVDGDQFLGVVMPMRA